MNYPMRTPSLIKYQECHAEHNQELTQKFTYVVFASKSVHSGVVALFYFIYSNGDDCIGSKVTPYMHPLSPSRLVRKIHKYINFEVSGTTPPTSYQWTESHKHHLRRSRSPPTPQIIYQVNPTKWEVHMNHEESPNLASMCTVNHMQFNVGWRCTWHFWEPIIYDKLSRYQLSIIGRTLHPILINPVIFLNACSFHHAMSEWTLLETMLFQEIQIVKRQTPPTNASLNWMHGHQRRKWKRKRKRKVGLK